MEPQRSLIQHKSRECIIYGLNAGACNSLQKWNPSECRCESKKLDGCASCKNGSVWNPSTCECETNEYLAIRNYSSEKNSLQ